MSDSTHTEGPFSHGFNLLANIESRDGLRTPVLLLEDEYNRARACWNACDGIDTDALEVTPDLNDLYDGVVAERNALRAEVALIKSHQDELLEVLAEMVVRFQNLRESNGLDRKSNLAKRAYELIAKAAEIAALKGGA